MKDLYPGNRSAESLPPGEGKKGNRTTGITGPGGVFKGASLRRKSAGSETTEEFPAGKKRSARQGHSKGSLRPRKKRSCTEKKKKKALCKKKRELVDKKEKNPRVKKKKGKKSPLDKGVVRAKREVAKRSRRR